MGFVSKMREVSWAPARMDERRYSLQEVADLKEAATPTVTPPSVSALARIMWDEGVPQTGAQTAKAEAIRLLQVAAEVEHELEVRGGAHRRAQVALIDLVGLPALGGEALLDRLDLRALGPDGADADLSAGRASVRRRDPNYRRRSRVGADDGTSCAPTAAAVSCTQGGSGLLHRHRFAAGTCAGFRPSEGHRRAVDAARCHVAAASPRT